MRRVILSILGGMTLAIEAAQVRAAETQSFSYDALGRLTKVERSGNINNGVQSSYQHDPASNRTALTVTGSQRREPVQIVVLPIGGLFVLPLPDPLSN